jgi:signal transduction histidine kinase
VVGVAEIVQDITTDSRQVFHYQTLILLTSGIVMGILFFALLMVVKRGERMIEKRAQERLRLEEQLAKAKHLSSLGEMTAGISHEIRNPLGIIRSSAELMAQKMAQLDPEESIPNIIVEEATRLDGIITDFLSYARPHKPHIVACQVTTVIEKTLSYLAPQMEADGHRVEKNVEQSLPPVKGDSDLLYQAFLNIFINAMQAMPDGGIIQVRLFRQLADIIIWFDNQGPPIDSNNMDKIWDPFFTTKDKGTGLGLGIVKNIMNAHSGRITICNLEKGGVRVEMRLPIALQDSSEIRVEEKPAV